MLHVIMIQEGREAKDLSVFFMLNIEILDCFSHYTLACAPPLKLEKI